MRFAFSLLFVFTLLPLGACDSANPDNQFFVTVTLMNADSQAIHILASDESFDLSNRLNPGVSRTVSLQGVLEGDSNANVNDTYSAGLNGTVTTIESCGFFGASPDVPSAPIVRYTQAGLLECVDWSP